MRAAATGLLVLAVALAGCGGGDKPSIPHDRGAILIRQLKKAQDAAGDEKQCPALFRAISAAQATVQSMPSSVDSDTRQTLSNGIKNLDDTARGECANANTQTTTTPTTDTTTTETTNTQPTQTTNTQPTQTTNTQTTPTSNTQTTPPPQTTPGNGGAEGPGSAPGQEKKGKGGKKDKPGKGPKK